MLEDEKKGEKLKKHDKGELAIFEARVYEAMGNTAKAIEILNRDVVINKVTKHENLARLYENTGYKDNAVNHYEELM